MAQFNHDPLDGVERPRYLGMIKTELAEAIVGDVRSKLAGRAYVFVEQARDLRTALKHALRKISVKR